MGANEVATGKKQMILSIDNILLGIVCYLCSVFSSRFCDSCLVSKNAAMLFLFTEKRNKKFKAMDFMLTEDRT